MLRRYTSPRPRQRNAERKSDEQRHTRHAQSLDHVLCGDAFMLPENNCPVGVQINEDVRKNIGPFCLEPDAKRLEVYSPVQSSSIKIQKSTSPGFGDGMFIMEDLPAQTRLPCSSGVNLSRTRPSLLWICRKSETRVSFA